MCHLFAWDPEMNKMGLKKKRDILWPIVTISINQNKFCSESEFKFK